MAGEKDPFQRPVTRRGALIGLLSAGTVTALAGIAAAASRGSVTPLGGAVPPEPGNAGAGAWSWTEPLPGLDPTPTTRPTTRPTPPTPGREPDAPRGARGLARGDRSDGQQIIRLENVHRGSSGWKIRLPADDRREQIKAYASATSVDLGERIDFHVSVNPAQEFRIRVYRLGWYGGLGGRLMTSSPVLRGTTQRPPATDPVTGMVSCDWTRSWSLVIPKTWVSGLYLAVCTNEKGFQHAVPFVVRDDAHPGEVLVVLPFTTYQAYNPYPLDNRDGKSLYYGFTPGGVQAATLRSRAVSFDRPYADSGLPNHFDKDVAFIQWAEREGYDVTYATSVDLHAGRVSPRRHRVLVFPGHDEYWSTQMRRVVEEARHGGTHQVWLCANNMYWRVRFEPNAHGVEDRVMVCYKDMTDPVYHAGGPTVLWRTVDQPEQSVLGAQYVAIVGRPAPLVASGTDHWFWAGTKVREGQRFPRLVGVEADAIQSRYQLPAAVEHVSLSASPFYDPAGRRRMQNTSLYQAPSGAWVFVAGTFHWPLALSKPGWVEPRIQQATENLFRKLLAK
ncbi:N,N-dimethylformamidase beta subunit family domain-containing protein [Carbonactinospora thermoautotrophica]|uniref:N,N-dimethylformamidase beta subunit family domain-containing protein n=1 Tax=Carbonactinospora thermoautotrophica TaxID=1469144 RepID=UPI00226E6330|nr:N,N-dimethylformamidase beta subunit family domain-containing protein [Carbonactinospora thermoautotrophica]